MHRRADSAALMPIRNVGTGAARANRYGALSWLQRCRKLLYSRAELGAMRFVERRTRCQRSRQLGQDTCQQSIMEVHYRLPPVFAWPYQPYGDGIGIRICVELRMPAKTADISLVGKIDRNLGLIENRM